MAIVIRITAAGHTQHGRLQQQHAEVVLHPEEVEKLRDYYPEVSHADDMASKAMDILLHKLGRDGRG